MFENRLLGEIFGAKLEERRLRVFENRLLGEIFGAK